MKILVQRDGSISTLQVLNVYIYDINYIKTMNIEKLAWKQCIVFPVTDPEFFTVYFFFWIKKKICGNFLIKFLLLKKLHTKNFNKIFFYVGSCHGISVLWSKHTYILFLCGSHAETGWFCDCVEGIWFFSNKGRNSLWYVGIIMRFNVITIIVIIMFLYSCISIFLYFYIPVFLYSWISIFLYSCISFFLYSWISIFLYFYIPAFLYSYIPVFLYSYIPVFLYSCVPVFLYFCIPTVCSYISVFLYSYISIFLYFNISIFVYSIDTVQMMQSYCDVLVIRHPQPGAVEVRPTEYREHIHQLIALKVNIQAMTLWSIQFVCCVFTECI